MTANDIKILTEKNYSENAKHLTLRELEEIADNCEYCPETEITNELVEAYHDDELDDYIFTHGEQS